MWRWVRYSRLAAACLRAAWASPLLAAALLPGHRDTQQCCQKPSRHALLSTPGRQPTCLPSRRPLPSLTCPSTTTRTCPPTPRWLTAWPSWSSCSAPCRHGRTTWCGTRGEGAWGTDGELLQNGEGRTIDGKTPSTAKAVGRSSDWFVIMCWVDCNLTCAVCQDA